MRAAPMTASVWARKFSINVDVVGWSRTGAASVSRRGFEQTKTDEVSPPRQEGRRTRTLSVQPPSEKRKKKKRAPQPEPRDERMESDGMGPYPFYACTVSQAGACHEVLSLSKGLPTSSARDGRLQGSEGTTLLFTPRNRQRCRSGREYWALRNTRESGIDGNSTTSGTIGPAGSSVSSKNKDRR